MLFVIKICKEVIGMMRFFIIMIIIFGVISAPVQTMAKNTDDPFAKVLKEKELKKVKKKVLTEEDIYDLAKKYESLLKRKQFMEALDILEQLPQKAVTPRQKVVKQYLLTYKTIEQEMVEGASPLSGTDDLDDFTKKVVETLYKEAWTAYISGNNDIAKDLLIHSIYLHRRNTRSKKMMEYCMGLKLGSYKVENIEEKYWRRSDTSFYGGNYESAVEALEVLTFFDRENPKIYEKMGSAYYMMSRKKEAVGSWKTAVFFGGKTKEKQLQPLINKTNKMIKEDNKKALARQKEREARKKKEAKASGDLKLMGVFNTQKKAYNYAADLKKQGLKPVVEEMPNGKFAVKIPKK
jgi:hypothetical protein